jgi:hypothetical protein
VKSIDGNLDFRATFVYGVNDYLGRHHLWCDLQNLQARSPWVILGDFNAIRSPSEKVGGDRSWLPWMDEFGACLQILELEDQRYSGCLFTWSNKQSADSIISTKIDRVMVNESWIKTFSWSNAHFLNPGVSDHSPAVVYLTPSPKPKMKPFKFFNFLADHPQFLQTIQGVWRRVILGNQMFCVFEKFKLLQAEFKKLNNKDYSDISTRVLSVQKQLESVQNDLGIDPSDLVKQARERDLSKEFLTLARAEESFARQKSRIQWLKLGDQCSSCFFKSVSNSRNRNRITSFVLDDGTITQNIDIIR